MTETPGRKPERAGGLGLLILMLCAFLLVAQRIYVVATGPLPPRPGTEAPDFSAFGTDGQKVTLSGLSGKVVLLDFWATWCPPCVASMPTLETIHQDYGPKGLVVLGVNQEPGEKDSVRAFLRRRNITFANVFDTSHVAGTYGVHSFPTSVLIDRGRVVRLVHRGPMSEGRLREAIESVIATRTSSGAHGGDT